MEMENLPEWERARTLNHYLLQRRLVTSDDVVIADGFWADGLEILPKAVSHSHGIWGHVTKEDVDRGIRPENPMHHAVQVEFRRRWIRAKRHITAVSEFIADQMELQWGFKVDRVINNGVDTEEYRPGRTISGGNDREGYICLNHWPRKRPLVIHGVNDRSNLNKGWDHIQAIIDTVDVDVMSLDEARESCRQLDPHAGNAQAICQADLVVHPSGFEGNSMFVAEALSCGIPVVGYNVGYMWSLWKVLGTCVMDRNLRSPVYTAAYVKSVLEAPDLLPTMGYIAREVALKDLSKENFARSWREYVEGIENA